MYKCKNELLARLALGIKETALIFETGTRAELIIVRHIRKIPKSYY